ncbi:MAG: cupin domain-containing protein [Gammaproteobacteria bacterium]|nr:cupin domain-containing protein [Gammaproteobacteria bacterium]
MNCHDDFLRAVAIDSTALAWQASPHAGVERRMLERVGGEVARATSVVRYAPGSAFAPHTHGGGEEFLVLDGVFCDDQGEYPRGWYVRNPPGSRHRPHSHVGATIFVKLRQMHADERERVCLDTRDPAGWRRDEGRIHARLLHEGFGERTEILEWPAGFAGAWTWPAGAEYFVLEGAFEDDLGPHGEGAWLRLPAGARQTVRTTRAARVYRKTGHLLHPVGVS